MPRGQRARQRQQAQTLRALGETIVLLINDDVTAPGSTPPASFVDAAAVPSPSTDRKITTYGRVSYHTLEDISMDEPGKVGNMKATVEIPFDQGVLLKGCYAIQTSFGILQIKSIQVTEERTSYLVETQGYENTLQD